MATATPISAASAINPAQLVMQIAGGYQLSACLQVAVKVNIADLLSAGPRAVESLAAETETNADALYRVLRALISVGIFAEPQPRTIALSPAAEILRSDAPGSVHGMVLWNTHPFLMHMCTDLLYSVQTGRSATEHLLGKPCFEHLACTELAFAFNEGMTAISADLAPAVLDAYDFSAIETLMDVAGGHGYFICQALKRHPHLKGILFDLSGVVEGAKCTLCDLRLDDRCQPLAGNFFEHIPAGADAYFMQHIIHDWSDEPALKILGNARQALKGRENGKLIIVDFVLPDDSQPHPGKLLDLLMLLIPGGRERTAPEWHALLDKAGFRITRVVPTKAAASVIEAVVS